MVRCHNIQIGNKSCVNNLSVDLVSWNYGLVTMIQISCGFVSPTSEGIYKYVCLPRSISENKVVFL
jgi:hypothetical protein